MGHQADQHEGKDFISAADTNIMTQSSRVGIIRMHQQSNGSAVI